MVPQVAIWGLRANGLVSRQAVSTMRTTRLVVLIALIIGAAALCERAAATCACCCTGFSFPLCDQADQESCNAVCADNKESAEECLLGQVDLCCGSSAATSDCVSGAPICAVSSPTATPTTTQTPTATATQTATATATGTVAPAAVPATSFAALLAGVLVLAILGLVALARQARRSG